MSDNRYAILKSALCVSVVFAAGDSIALDDIPSEISAWTERGIVLSHGAQGSWDEVADLVEPIGTYKKDGVYYMFYTAGFRGCWTADDATSYLSVGLATSTDGVNFQKYSGNPVLKPHDFVPVHSHEEGIRTASIRYVPEENRFVGFFAVESPGGTNSCPFMGSTAQCSCDVEVDAYIYSATSQDGIAWTIDGEVKGVGNQAGQENYVDDFHYQGGQYYLWTHKAEGGHQHFVARGSSRTSMSLLGDVPSLCWGWSQLKSFLHDDNNTITLIYDPNGGCAAQDANLYFSRSTLSQPRSIANERVIHSRSGERTNSLLKDPESGVWRWYYNKSSGADRGSVRLRTHPLSDAARRPMTPGNFIVE